MAKHTCQEKNNIELGNFEKNEKKQNMANVKAPG